MASPSTLPADSVGSVDTQFLDLPASLPLDCGRELRAVRVAYETYGTLSPERDNAILVCHALSGDAHAAGLSGTAPAASTRDGFAAERRDGAAGKALGWWDGMIGPGKAFDTDHYFVISTNLLGGCRGTTGPSSINPDTGRAYGSDFPVVTVADMVRCERAFLDELGIERLAAVAGGSLGGMQALQWAVMYPEQVDSIVVIASTHALHTQGVAWNAIAREAITRDPAWQGGDYYGTGRAPSPAWGWPGWSGTSPTCRRPRSASGSAAGCSPPTTCGTRSGCPSSRSRATSTTRPTRSCGASTPTPICGCPGR
ncbi:homoserine O-acetyltransferase family protein [Paractinoplanes durhamensis]|uniref:homoserine O-acetyltransferase family protein n=1 Tax=Paractinoplanes durhamensis TaxID=113563 RepID=UPI003644C817